MAVLLFLLGTLCQLYIDFFQSFPHYKLCHALCCSLSVWASSQINCHAANRFWEAERESLSKRRLWLGVGQRTEMPVWLHPNFRSRMHCTQNGAELVHVYLVFCREKQENDGTEWYRVTSGMKWNMKHYTLKLLLHINNLSFLGLGLGFDNLNKVHCN